MEKRYLSKEKFTNLQTLLRVNFVYFYSTKQLSPMHHMLQYNRLN